MTFSFQIAYPEHILVVDINGDCQNDVIVNSGIYINQTYYFYGNGIMPPFEESLLSSGDATFSTYNELFPQDAGNLYYKDFTGDGHKDLLVRKYLYPNSGTYLH